MLGFYQDFCKKIFSTLLWYLLIRLQNFAAVAGYLYLVI